MKFMIAFALLALSSQAFAKKYALVIGGAAKDNSPRNAKSPRFHEFGQASARAAIGYESKGYEVTTLFDSVGIKSEKNVSDDKWKEDHAQFKKLNAKAASAANIEEALKKMVKNAKKGDEIEINLFAHGFRSCEGDKGGMKGLTVSDSYRSNSNAKCKHVIDLTDPATGETTRIDTAILKKHLEDLDKKGARTNLNLASCHSGAAQDLFSGLKNTCTTYLASANNVGLGCFPSDKDGDISYTSTIDMIMASSWVHMADQMKNDPYLKEDRCLGVISDHYNKNNIGGDNRYDLYMSARAHDKNPHEPTISALNGHNYFKEGNFSAVLRNAQNATADKLECLPNVEARLDEMLIFGGELATIQLREELKGKLGLLSKEIDEYNLLIDAQIKEVGKGLEREEEMKKTDGKMEADKVVEVVKGSNTEISAEKTELDFGDMEMPKAPAGEDRVKYYINETMAKAEKVMAIERDIIAQVNEKILRPKLDSEDPCLK